MANALLHSQTRKSNKNHKITRTTTTFTTTKSRKIEKKKTMKMLCQTTHDSIHETMIYSQCMSFYFSICPILELLKTNTNNISSSFSLAVIYLVYFSTRTEKENKRIYDQNTHISLGARNASVSGICVMHKLKLQFQRDKNQRTK